MRLFKYAMFESKSRSRHAISTVELAGIKVLGLIISVCVCGEDVLMSIFFWSIIEYN